MFCPLCGSKVATGATRCAECGRQLPLDGTRAPRPITGVGPAPRVDELDMPTVQLPPRASGALPTVPTGAPHGDTATAEADVFASRQQPRAQPRTERIEPTPRADAAGQTALSSHVASGHAATVISAHDGAREDVTLPPSERPTILRRPGPLAPPSLDALPPRRAPETAAAPPAAQRGPPPGAVLPLPTSRDVAPPVAASVRAAPPPSVAPRGRTEPTWPAPAKSAVGDFDLDAPTLPAHATVASAAAAERAHTATRGAPTAAQRHQVVVASTSRIAIADAIDIVLGGGLAVAAAAAALVAEGVTLGWQPVIDHLHAALIPAAAALVVAPFVAVALYEMLGGLILKSTVGQRLAGLVLVDSGSGVAASAPRLLVRAVLAAGFALCAGAGPLWGLVVERRRRGFADLLTGTFAARRHAPGGSPV